MNDSSHGGSSGSSSSGHGGGEAKSSAETKRTSLLLSVGAIAALGGCYVVRRLLRAASKRATPTATATAIEPAKRAQEQEQEQGQVQEQEQQQRPRSQSRRQKRQRAHKKGSRDTQQQRHAKAVDTASPENSTQHHSTGRMHHEHVHTVSTDAARTKDAADEVLDDRKRLRQQANLSQEEVVATDDNQDEKQQSQQLQPSQQRDPHPSVDSVAMLLSQLPHSEREALQGFLAAQLSQTSIASFMDLDVQLQMERNHGSLGGLICATNSSDSSPAGPSFPLEFLDGDAVLSAVSEAIYPQELAQLHTFLEVIRKQQQEAKKPVAKSACGHFGDSDQLSNAYFRGNHKSLLNTCAHLRLSLQVVQQPHDGSTAVTVCHGSTALTFEQLEMVLRDLRMVFSYHNIFNYKHIIQRTIVGCAEVLAKHLPFLGDIQSALNAVRVAESVASGEPTMIPYEISFQTNMAQHEVSFPNPYTLSEQHVELMLKNSAIPSLRQNDKTRTRMCARGELFLQFYLECFAVTCHEVIHCVQHYYDQHDYDPARMSWSAEHDASYASLSLFWLVSQLPSMSDILGNGIAEQVLFTSLMAPRSFPQGWSAAERKEYEAWRDSFGIQSPTKLVNVKPRLVREFKSLISAEGYIADERHAVEQLALLFRDRTGDVRKKQVIVPDYLVAKSLLPK